LLSTFSIRQSHIALVDCQKFYASCHSVFSEWTRHIPTVVLSNNDGCIIAINDKAKKFGFKMGQNFFEATAELRRLGVRVFSSNYTFYGDISDRVVDGLRHFSPKIEVYSIDECFMEFSHYDYPDLSSVGHQLVHNIFRWVRMPVTFAAGNGKGPAKIASYFAKKDPALKGVLHLRTDKQLDAALREIPVQKIWYIGPKSAKKLRKVGIKTGAEFRDADSCWIKKMFTVVGWRLQRELRGYPCIPLELKRKSKKGIGHTRGFRKMVDNKRDLRAALASFTARAALKLRQEKSCVNKVSILIETNPFRDDLPQYRNLKTVSLNVATNSSIEICSHVFDLLNQIYRDGYKYKRAGVLFDDLVPTNTVQLNLFDQYPRKKDAKAMGILDKINSTQGRDTLWIGSQELYERDSTWHMAQEFKSPCYTTKWSDIPSVSLK